MTRWGWRVLLVMATGTGKTFTAFQIIHRLWKSSWRSDKPLGKKRILFLADRNALLKQAYRAFQRHLPSVTVLHLTRSKDVTGANVLFSTYQTMLNAIDRMDAEGRIFGVGYFDLVIVDEAHRSIYQKYGEIFDYFDALLVGLTATPRSEIDRDTYRIFQLPQGVPTFAYELNDAVRDGHLVPPKGVTVPFKFLRTGVKYSDLTPEEQLDYEEKFRDEETGELADFSGRESLGACPRCGSPVHVHGSNYVCAKAVPTLEQAAPSCDFKSGTTILQQEIAPEQMSKLLATGKTDLLEKFVSNKTKRAFKAFLAWDAEAGKVGFEFKTTGGLRNTIKNVGDKFELRTAHIPLIDPVNGKLPTGGNAAVMLTRDADKQEAAWKFIEFAYGDANREKFDVGEGFLPVTKNVAALPYFNEDPDVAGFAAGLPYAKFAPVIANWEEIADVTVRTMQQIYLGEVTPEDGLKAAAAEVNKIRGL